MGGPQMITIVRRTTVALTGLLIAGIAAFIAAPLGLAHQPPADGNGVIVDVPATPSQITVHHGSPIWVFVVVALIAVAVTLIAQQLVVRTRPMLRRRRLQNA
jgi:hypothetical protein